MSSEAHPKHNLIDHTLDSPGPREGVRYEKRPILAPGGDPAQGLHAAWITLDNPDQLNSYTTDMVKDVILAFRRASEERDVVSVVFTGSGTRAFCTGGNVKEYAEYYAGRPQEYARYMRLFADMVSAILLCDKPVINRVNGMRIAGGQELGMACDFSIASDLAQFGQAGPKHGSAPDGGSTDFLPLYVGIERAMVSCTLCEPWTAYEALRYGLITEAVPALSVDGKVIPNPLVTTDRWLDEMGRVVHGTQRTGDDLKAGKALLKNGTVDLSGLDAKIEGYSTKLLMTMPGCLSKTIESVRKHKLEHWDRNKETNRAWLALNMAGEGKLGFRAFMAGDRSNRDADFAGLRRAIARGETLDDELVARLMPRKGGAV
jgi:6-oxo-cyclohex-1-ene-carbonyl-CoA hydrolase